MKIILSPTKKMISATDDFSYQDLPIYLDKTNELLKILSNLSYDELKRMWKCNDTLAKENSERLKEMNLYEGLSPAVFSYVGLAFQHMAPNIMTENGLAYIQENLRILSGFYGILKPFDGIRPYRLEMQASVPHIGSLYNYWGDALAHTIQDEIIINLASKEYSDVIKPYVKKENWITIDFVEEKDGKLIQKGTLAKMARGEMVYWLAENQIQSIKEIEKYDINYHFEKEYSTDTEFVFVKNK